MQTFNPYRAIAIAEKTKPIGYWCHLRSLKMGARKVLNITICTEEY
jgi:hypothetical protein